MSELDKIQKEQSEPRSIYKSVELDNNQSIEPLDEEEEEEDEELTQTF